MHEAGVRTEHDLGKGDRFAGLVLALVGEQALGVLHFAHGERAFVAVPEGLAHAVAHPGERGVFHGVGAFFLGGGKGNGDAAAADVGDQAETEIGFGLADPALAHCEGHGGSGLAVSGAQT